MATATVEKRLRCESVKDGPSGGALGPTKAIVVREATGYRRGFVVPAGAVQGGCVTVQVFERDGRTWAVIPPQLASFPLGFAADAPFAIYEGDLLDPDPPPWDRAAADRRDRGLADVFG